VSVRVIGEGEGNKLGSRVQHLHHHDLLVHLIFQINFTSFSSHHHKRLFHSKLCSNHYSYEGLSYCRSNNVRRQLTDAVGAVHGTNVVETPRTEALVTAEPRIPTEPLYIQQQETYNIVKICLQGTSYNSRRNALTDTEIKVVIYCHGHHGHVFLTSLRTN